MLATVAAIAVVFFAFGLCADPIPGINEPHYLGKARHFWDPRWCAGDLFLESANAHVVFYATFGWLTVLFGLQTAAVLGRALACTVLAWGWTAMVRVLTARLQPDVATQHRAADACVGRPASLPARRRSPLQSPLSAAAVWLSAAAYLSLYLCGGLAGEWMVGGVEGKVPAYGLAFAAFARLAEARWYGAAALGGLAVAFHPVAGGWMTIAALVAVLWEWLPRRGTRSDATLPCPGLRGLAVAAAVWILAAAPGLIPAARMLLRSDPVAAWQANVIQVYYRLRHHLDPQSIPPAAWIRYGVLLAGWWWLRRSSIRRDTPPSGSDAFPRNRDGSAGPAPFCETDPPTQRQNAVDRARGLETISARLLARVVVFGIAIASVAVLCGLPGRPENFGEGKWRLAFLKLYPLRLLDVMLPVAGAVELARWICGRRLSADAWRRALPVAAAAGLLATIAFAAATPSQGRMPDAWQPAWVSICGWIRQHTPPQALCLAPRTYSRTFKWYAERPEYVNYKDCPQDARSLVEWNRRLRIVQQWASEHYDDNRYSADELAELRRRTGIAFLLVRRLGPMTVAPDHAIGPFRLYDLRKYDLGEPPD
ncbi:MAG: hypothetical protein D6725_02540 [Planctomycetota bacterium]|nr:MAG: hypothetical protein D6725_02540 [Planctomycetota bacterium]